MSKKRKLGWLLLGAFISFWVTYGLWPDFRDGVNDFVVYTAAPAINSAVTGISTSISQTPAYQAGHPIVWMVVGGLGLFGVQRLWSMHTAKELLKKESTISERFQDRPLETPPEEVPIPTASPAKKKPQAVTKPEEEKLEAEVTT